MEDVINNFQEYKNQSLESIALLDVIQKLLSSMPLREGLEFIAFHSKITNKLTSSDGETVGIYEILPNGKILCVYHPDDNISKHYLDEIEEYFHTISQNKPGGKHLNQIINEMIKIYENNPVDYQHIDYIRNDQDMILSRSYKSCNKSSLKRRELITIKEIQGHRLLLCVGFFIYQIKCVTPNIKHDEILKLIETEDEDKLILNNGEVISIKKTYYETGQLKSKMKFQDNILHGKSVIYYPNGNIKKQVNYCKGKKNGKSVEYHPNSNIKSDIMYIMDVPQGKLMKWYENGQVAYEQVYANHKIEGTTKAYNHDGSLMYEI